MNSITLLETSVCYTNTIPILLRISVSMGNFKLLSLNYFPVTIKSMYKLVKKIRCSHKPKEHFYQISFCLVFHEYYNIFILINNNSIKTM